MLLRLAKLYVLLPKGFIFSKLGRKYVIPDTSSHRGRELVRSSARSNMQSLIARYSSSYLDLGVKTVDKKKSVSIIELICTGAV